MDCRVVVEVEFCELASRGDAVDAGVGGGVNPAAMGWLWMEWARSIVAVVYLSPRIANLRETAEQRRRIDGIKSGIRIEDL